MVKMMKQTMSTTEETAKQFYETAYRETKYAGADAAAAHFEFKPLREFIAQYQLHNARCLEVGCGRGAFQEMVRDYTGVDLSEAAGQFLTKPFFVASGESLPFADGTFDVVWSITVLEHIPDPEKALAEIRRVLKPGGLLYLKPAWHCRPWNCEGIPVRPYSNLTLRQKWVKATLPIRNSLWFRAMQVFPGRCVQLLQWIFWPAERPLNYRPLRPDYKTFWMADSDAACSLDPMDVIVWFTTRGDQCLSHPTKLAAFLSRSSQLIIRRSK